jgi:GDP-4-dehydro-6-deoxy-D-mannose reductase
MRESWYIVSGQVSDNGAFMKIVITGATGFVGPHLVDVVRHLCPAAELVPTSKDMAPNDTAEGVEALDITNRASVEQFMDRHRPGCIINLAGIAAPAAANANPDLAWKVNLGGVLNLAYSILTHAPNCVLVNIGSGLVYGGSARSGKPVDETALLEPIDEYAATKAAADLSLGALVTKGLKCVRMRPFNHTGPSQGESFVVPAFAMQIARIEAGLQPPTIKVGNLAARRDLLHVRDVATAYGLVLRRLHSLEPGIVLNVASGTAWSMEEILHGLLAQTAVPIKIERDEKRFRAADLPIIIGNADRAGKLLDWFPKFDLEQTLADVLADCRAKIARPR